MKDRFKFRVWVKEKEGVFDGEYLEDCIDCTIDRDGDLCAGVYVDDGYAGHYDRYKQDEVIIEQCTGLKDKNDKLIYEGDKFVPIYVNPFGDCDPDLDDFDFDRQGIVEFKNGMFGFQTKTEFLPLERFIPKSKGEYISNAGNKVLYGDKLLIKIIGNINQNPDMLGDK